jgi:hypothetical protein
MQVESWVVWSEVRLRVGWEWVSMRDGEWDGVGDGEEEEEEEDDGAPAAACTNNAYAQAFNSSAAIAGGRCTGHMYLM